MDIGDVVVYNGKRIIIDYFIWNDLYNFLKVGGEYKIGDITESAKGPPGELYFRLDLRPEGRGNQSI